jgi:hypothetical protein
MPVRDGNLAVRMDLQAQCPFFEKLPPEIRNEIYEYVFTTNDPSSRQNLAKIERPCLTLLLTSQRIFAESSTIYESVRTAFWTESIFHIHRGRQEVVNGPSPRKIVKRLHDRELDLMQKVVITFEPGPYNITLNWPIHLTPRGDGMRGWNVSKPDIDDTKFATVVGKRSGLLHVLVVTT